MSDKQDKYKSIPDKIIGDLSDLIKQYKDHRYKYQNVVAKIANDLPDLVKQYQDHLDLQNGKIPNNKMMPAPFPIGSVYDGRVIIDIAQIDPDDQDQPLDAISIKEQ